MNLTAFRLLAAFLLLPTFRLCAQDKKPRTQNEPAWVTHNTTFYNAHTLDSEAEDGIVDLAYEKQIFLPDEAVFTRRVIKFLSEGGIQSSSEVSVNFDPAYQQLIFHDIKLIRNGRSINKLELGKMKTLQQEKELRNYLYNGSYTTVLFLEDVQKGDVLEYSYTVKGFNPIFGGRYSGFLDVDFSVPVYQVYYKLVVPTDRSVIIKNSKTVVTPVVTPTANGKEYEWRLNNVPALHVENNLPDWYDPYGMIMISEFKSWKEVNDWALQLFPFSDPLSAPLKNKISELRKLHKNPIDQMQAALRFVQDDIRYLGIEMGENSHKPHLPNEVLQQRFGDCKDKAYLLCTLLRGLGIDAQPVLINTEYKQAIETWLPAPIDFDHTTVRVALQGNVYWFDPTISFQRGAINAISFPNYGTGLVISNATTQLTSIPLHTKSEVVIKEVFTIPDMTGKGNLKVITQYHGASADNTRNDFKTSSNYELRKTYRDFYAGYLSTIKADSLLWADDENTGVFTTTEYYTIDSIWGAFSYMKEATFEPYVINTFLKKLDNAKRIMPYALQFPVKYTEEIEINLPEIWNVKQSDHSSISPAFILQANYRCTGKQVHLKYEFQILKDHLAPNEIADYNIKMDKAIAGIGYSLTSTVTETVSPALTSGGSYAMLYVILGICVFITYTLRKWNR